MRERDLKANQAWASLLRAVELEDTALALQEHPEPELELARRIMQHERDVADLYAKHIVVRDDGEWEII